jgi:riboflavin synthase
MFTGIIEHQGRVVSLRPQAWGARLEIDACGWAHVPAGGDSIAINGCCLTVVAAPGAGGVLAFDVIPQTLSLTTIGALAVGEEVNLEHAATAATLLGGHIVQGHVDAVGEVLAVSTAGGEWRTRIAAPVDVMDLAVDRGSIAVDGVSLTIAATGSGWFEIALIPTTLAKTALRDRQAGSRVNLESDPMAKMIAVQVQRMLAAGAKRP